MFSLVGVLSVAPISGLPTEVPDVSRLPVPLQRTIDYQQEVMPLFQMRCYSCHGPEKQKSGLRLDLKRTAFAGGQRGPAILPGRSSESLLVHYIAGLDDEMRMPPAKGGGKPLSVDEIALVRAWIDQGASWPGELESPSVPSRTEHWAFQPVRRPSLPKLPEHSWPRNEIDLFIWERLHQNNLEPSSEADRRTLIRRVSFDMVGLPPTPDEINAFVRDDSLDAYERMVDRILNSPRYGERWARHWLDSIHFGETHGYDKDKTRPNAWPYRDYLIRSFNQDKPYSCFVEEQLAGDILFPDAPDGVMALGFLAAGPWDFVGHVELPETKTDGLIARYNDRDDMVMTTMATFQSLTVHCARCHDHKFDPIRQEDYYRLQSVFAGIDRADRWFDSDPVIFRARKQLLAEKKRLDSQQEKLNQAVLRSSPTVFRLIDARRDELKKQIASLVKSTDQESPGNGYHSEITAKADMTKWVQIDLKKKVPVDEIVLVPARPTDFADTPGFGFPVRFRVEVSDASDFSRPKLLLDRTDADFPNPGNTAVVVQAHGEEVRWVRVTATRLWERTSDYVFALAELQVQSAGQNAAVGASVEALDSIEAGRWSKRFLSDGFDSRKRLDLSQEAMATAAKQKSLLEEELQLLSTERAALVVKLVDEETRKELAATQTGLAHIQEQMARLPAPSQVFAVGNDFPSAGNFKPAREPRPVHVLKRGEVKQPTHLADPGSLSCLPGLESRFDLAGATGEGPRRAALAHWITTPSNMLTRRSIVNRVWHYHFGRGLVETPNDFGHMGAQPSHPELLDWLAFWFLDHGESLKKLHRLILTSAVYRQSSAQRVEGARVDSENRFLWRMNRSRLDAESLRDTILEVAGRLDPTMGGPSVQQFMFKDDHSPVYDYSLFDIESPAAFRRSVYRFIVRSVPDPFMETMDCPDPSLLTPKRSTTMTALQALALLNDPFVLRQAEVFAGQAVKAAPEDVEKQVQVVWERALGRPPIGSELSKLVDYTRQYGTTNLCRLVFNTSEFVFVD